MGWNRESGRWEQVSGEAQVSQWGGNQVNGESKWGGTGRSGGHRKWDQVSGEAQVGQREAQAVR